MSNKVSAFRQFFPNNMPKLTSSNQHSLTRVSCVITYIHSDTYLTMTGLSSLQTYTPASKTDFTSLSRTCTPTSLLFLEFTRKLHYKTGWKVLESLAVLASSLINTTLILSQPAYVTCITCIS